MPHSAKRCINFLRPLLSYKISVFQQHTWCRQQLNLRSSANNPSLHKVHWFCCKAGCTIRLCTAQSRRQPFWQFSSALLSQVELLLSYLACENYFLHVTYYVQTLQRSTPRKPVIEKKCAREWYSSYCQAFYLCPGFAATSGKQCRRSRYAMQSCRLCKADADTKQSIILTLSQIDY